MKAPSVIFLPGFMCDGRLFGAQMKHLSAIGYDCRAGDLSGAATIERMASTVLSDAPARFALVGLSMGGIVAFEIMRQAPDRVTHLALLNTTARRDTAGQVRKNQMKRVVAGELSLVLREELKPQYLAEANRKPSTLSLLESMGQQLGVDAFVQQTMALTIRRDAFDVLGEIRCPTLVLAGADDRVCPVDRHKEIARQVKGSKLQILESCGHISTLEKPDEVSDALQQLLELRAVRDGSQTPPLLRLIKNPN
jgi:pimeloyl-ACP methyl ester carboxylesterase